MRANPVTGVLSQVDQGYRVCIEPRKMYNCGHRINLYLQGKADSLDALEGSSPECDMASVQVTTGV
jgi:hypothetical protein